MYYKRKIIMGTKKTNSAEKTPGNRMVESINDWNRNEV